MNSDTAKISACEQRDLSVLKETARELGHSCFLRQNTMICVHNARQSLWDLEAAIAAAPLTRVGNCREEINLALHREQDCTVLEEADPLTKREEGIIFAFGEFVCADQLGRAEHCFDLARFESCVAGFLEGIQGQLSPTGRTHLPWAVRLVALECGIRNLIEFLNEKDAFRSSYSCEKLQLCGAWFKLLLEMESQFAQMQRTVSQNNQ